MGGAIAVHAASKVCIFNASLHNLNIRSIKIRRFYQRQGGVPGLVGVVVIEALESAWRVGSAASADGASSTVGAFRGFTFHLVSRSSCRQPRCKRSSRAARRPRDHCTHARDPGTAAAAAGGRPRGPPLREDADEGAGGEGAGADFAGRTEPGAALPGPEGGTGGARPEVFESEAAAIRAVVERGLTPRPSILPSPPPLPTHTHTHTHLTSAIDLSPVLLFGPALPRP